MRRAADRFGGYYSGFRTALNQKPVEAKNDGRGKQDTGEKTIVRVRIKQYMDSFSDNSKPNSPNIKITNKESAPHAVASNDTKATAWATA